MDLTSVIKQRRAYRSLEPAPITPELIADLATHAQLAPSCFNHQPWRYVFVYEPDQLQAMHEALTPGNLWATNGSLIIAVLSEPALDCVIKEREYYAFDTGLATAFLILRATELGLVAHPIAGYSPSKTRAVLGIPDRMAVLALVIVGRRSAGLQPEMSEAQIETERARPERKPLADFVFHQHYQTAEPQV